MTAKPFSIPSSRSRVEGGALLAVIALLCALAVLQYRWLGDIALGERRKLSEEAAEKASAIAQDIDREITRVFLELRLEASPTREKEDPAFAERLARWRADAAHERLVKDVFVAEPGPSGSTTLLRFDPTRRTFVEESWPDSLARVRALVETGAEAPLPLPVPLPLAPTTVLPDVPALVFPVVNVVVNQHATPASVTGSLGQVRQLFLRHAGRGPVEILLLDDAYLKEKVVAALARTRLGSDSAFEWSIVKSEGGASVAGAAPGRAGVPDAKAPVLRIRFDDLDRSLLRSILPGLAPGLTEGPTGSSVRFMVQLSGPGSTSRVGGSSSSAPWTLQLRHKEGSIAAAVLSQQRRNAALSGSILGVLGLSAGLVFFSARRLRAIATQQVEFVAAVSHELRTPLAVIRSAADNLADGVVEGKDQAKRYGALIRNESVRLADMVEHVLEFAGADAPARAARGPIDVADAVRAAVDGMAALSGERGARVDVDIANEPLKVTGDLSHLTRAISNLLGNALKYGGDAPRVDVQVRRATDQVRITIADRGAGLTPGEIPHLFEPFYRGQRASEAQIPGSGLGLALVKRIVESHGGQVAASNGPSGGALFTVTLPAV